MAAYAAVVSLKHTINGLVNSSTVSSTREILKSASHDTVALQRALERSKDRARSSERLDGLEGQIRDLARKLEDILEFYELNHLCSQVENDASLTLMPDVEDIREEIIFFAQTAKKMGEDYLEELSKPEPDGDAINSTTDTDFGVDMVGHSSKFEQIQEHLLDGMRPDDLCIFSIFGQKGSGITASATAVYEDLRSDGEKRFDRCAWVNVGKKPRLKKVLTSILEQVDNLAAWEYELLALREDEVVCQYLYDVLEHQRYMIMLEDVWNVEVVEYLENWLPDQAEGSIVFLTTSVTQVAESADNSYSFDQRGCKYMDEVFWGYVRAWFFGTEPIPPGFERIGRKIVRNCRGGAISFSKTLLFLIKSDKTLDQWTKLAADKRNSIFIIADEISEISQIKMEMQYANWDIDDEIRKIIFGFISFITDFSDPIGAIKTLMYPKRFFSRMQIISSFGMAGIGKSAIMRKLFQDKSILSHFDHRVWIDLDSKYQAEDILVDILSGVYPTLGKLHMKEDENLIKELCIELSSKRCLLVLDNLCTKQPLHHLKTMFPNIKGTILVTTRLVKVAKFEADDTDFEMELLDEEESWCLLHQTIFGIEPCPPDLEKFGREIAEKCDGLPLLILTVADKLLKAEISQDYWRKVASGKKKSVFENAHRQISKQLLPCYDSLPQHLKTCFLYMGVFCERYKIPTHDLSNLWISEGFLDPYSPQMVEHFVVDCLSELIDRSLIIVQLKMCVEQMRTCRLHSVFWHLSNSQSVKIKFFHAMNCYEDCSIENMESQHRLCIRKGILLALRDVQSSMVSVTNAHSLLCVNLFHQYPVPINFELRLLRVLNAVTIRLFEFPIEVVRLLHLKYLSLTCDGELPTSICNLQKLQYLIVKRYMNIKSKKNSSSLPMEIWDMIELKHLQIMEGNLPNPKGSACLPNLSTLLDLCAQSCTKEVLKMVPNLKRLGIRIELTPDDDGNCFGYLNNISTLSRLESLKCVVINPQIRGGDVSLPAPITMFPASLKKLSLNGLGYPWEYMSIISKLEKLEVLKLKSYAFHGPTWEIDHTWQSCKLRLLLIEDTDLVQWKVNWLIKVALDRLCIRHCYKLKELPFALPIGEDTKIEIVDCNRLTVTWGEKMAESVTDEVESSLSWIAHA